MTETLQPARALWMRYETIHAVTYFGAESADAAKAIGLDSWWKGYFAFRGAPPLALCSGAGTQELVYRSLGIVTKPNCQGGSDAGVYQALGIVPR